MASAAPASADIPPSPTLYINNLNSKIKKAAMKKNLYAVFSPFGKIVDIVAIRTNKLRGQAWVVFGEAGAATNALRQMQGFPFFDKPMRITFAKGKSDALAKADGTFVPHEKRKRVEEAAAGGAGAGAGAGARKAAGGDGDDDDDGAREPSSKRAARGQGPVPTAASAAADAPPVAPAILAAPSPTVLATGLPSEATEAMLSALFAPFAGYAGIRIVPARGIAFVDFTDIASSTAVVQALNNFRLTESDVMRLTFHH